MIPQYKAESWPISLGSISFSLSTVIFLLSSLLRISLVRRGNCRRGFSKPHNRLSMVLHRLRRRPAITGQPFFRATSNKARMMRPAFYRTTKSENKLFSGIPNTCTCFHVSHKNKPVEKVDTSKSLHNGYITKRVLLLQYQISNAHL